MCHWCEVLESKLPENRLPLFHHEPEADPAEGALRHLPKFPRPKGLLIPAPMVRLLHRSAKPYFGAWYRRRLGVMEGVLKVRSPMKRIKLDKLDGIADLFDDVQEEIEKLRRGLEVHGDEPEWEWWHRATEKRDAKNERKKAEKERENAARDAGAGEGGEQGGDGGGGGGVLQLNVEDGNENGEVERAGHPHEAGPAGTWANEVHGNGHEGDDDEFCPRGRPSARVFMRAMMGYYQDMAAEKKARQKQKQKHSVEQQGGGVGRKGLCRRFGLGGKKRRPKPRGAPEQDHDDEDDDDDDDDEDEDSIHSHPDNGGHADDTHSLVPDAPGEHHPDGEEDQAGEEPDNGVPAELPPDYTQ